MSWLTDKSNITTILKNRGYKEVEGNLDIVEEASVANRNKCFTLRPIGASVSNLTNGSSLDLIETELKISYICNTNSKADKAFDEMLETLEDIYLYINSYTSDITFDRNDENNNYWVSTSTFLVGAQVCN